MKYWVLIFTACFTQLQATAQKAKADSTTVLYATALTTVDEGNFPLAEQMLKKIISFDSTYVEPYITLGGVLAEQKKYKEAVTYMQKGFALDTVNFSFFLLPYSINLAGAGNFAEALVQINKFLLQPNLSEKSKQSALYRKSCYEFALQWQQDYALNKIEFLPKNLGDGINSSYAEYYPSSTITDSIFVFTRRAFGREDFYESTLQKGGKYSQANLINGSINELPSKGAINISQDGEWLAFAANYPNGFGNYDIYISYYTPTGWSEPINLGANINSEAWESSPAISPDKQKLFFSSDRKGGKGGKDIYVSTRNKKGFWQPAVNLGELVNSHGDELAPFMHADGIHLYFSSNGLPGYGNMDLFVTKQDSAGNWLKPVNAGYPINTIDHEGSLFIAANAEDAFYAADGIDSRGSLDIYTFKIPPHFAPLRTVYIQGTVIDSSTRKGIPATVFIYKKNNASPVGEVQTDEQGKYLITMPANADYTLTVQRKGYWYYEQNTQALTTTVEKTIALKPLNSTKEIILHNLQFAQNDSVPLLQSTATLQTLLQFMQNNPEIAIRITGHTDAAGKSAFNTQLSKARAKYVANYLFTNGIPAKRLQYVGLGSTRPLADNTTEAGRAKNRRTEVEIIPMR
ncbi:MAG: flagellar motor protein MotB [Bacteroidetes bacterium]|nr:MAG: flagellar motor protein MotB [Bacteroidota bacterium]